jgi:hypothetical protein
VRRLELTEFIELPLFATWAVEFEWEGLPPELTAIGQRTAPGQDVARADADRSISREQWWASVREDDNNRDAPDYKAKYDRANRLLDEQESLIAEERKNAPYIDAAIKKRLSEIRRELRDGPDELNGWTPPETTEAPKAASPISRARAQDAAILAEIRICNHDPLKLTKAPAGKPGVKAEIRKRLILQTDIFVSRKVFEDAWQRLRDQDDIRDA